MITINVPGYNSNEKLTLAKDYLMPEILKQYNIEKEGYIKSGSKINISNIPKSRQDIEIISPKI